MGSKMYAVDERLINERPEIRIGTRVYKVDNRLSCFEKMNTELKACMAGAEFETIIKNALGGEALTEIKDMDLAFSAMHKIVVLIMAAIQDIPEEAAEKRFQKYSLQ